MIEDVDSVCAGRPRVQSRAAASGAGQESIATAPDGTRTSWIGWKSPITGSVDVSYSVTNAVNPVFERRVRRATLAVVVTVFIVAAFVIVSFGLTLGFQVARRARLNSTPVPTNNSVLVGGQGLASFPLRPAPD